MRMLLSLQVALCPSVIPTARRLAARHIEELVDALEPYIFTQQWYGVTDWSSATWPAAIGAFVDQKLVPELHGFARWLSARRSRLRSEVEAVVHADAWVWAEQNGRIRDLGGPWNDRRPAIADEPRGSTPEAMKPRRLPRRY